MCFTCKEPWTPDHRCLDKGKIHYVEVLSEDDDEQQEGSDDQDSDEEERKEQPLKEKKKKTTTEQPPIIATLSSDPACHPFLMKGVV